jgi:hypothetical protein
MAGRSRAQIRAICTSTVTATRARVVLMPHRSPAPTLCGCDTQGLGTAGTSHVVGQVLCCIGRLDLTT